MKLDLRIRQMLKFIHVLLSSFWAGTIVCILLIITTNRYSTGSLNQVYILNLAIKRIITYITIPSVIGSYIVGNIIAKSTNWEKYLWVRIKRPFTAITFLTVCLYTRSLVSRLVSITQTNNPNSLTELKYNSDRQTIIILCIIQIIVVLFLFVISYLKPWMKKANKSKI